jgi:hypothetical protein
MRHRKLGLGLAGLAAFAAALPLLAQPAYADYAPSKGDVVGVGSDTLQYMIDFMSDGDAYADPGYNAALNKFKEINFDATADANARLAYGVDGGQASQLVCTPGTGGTKGTGNGTTTHADQPCVLNPTIVLRAGQQPVQRPNGSGAGIAALKADVQAGNNLASGPHQEIINFSRASAAQAPASTFNLDDIHAATDTLPMLVASTTNAVTLDSTELGNIYKAATTGTNAYGGTGCVTWNELPNNAGGSTDTIIPIIPQVGSGTRSFFLAQIGNVTPGNCDATGEENDPTAIANQSTPADAIEPISLGRLNLFLGTTNSFSTAGQPAGYFLDESCPYLANITACANGGTGSITYADTEVANADNGVNITALGGNLPVNSVTGFKTPSGSIEVETLSGQAVLNYTGVNAGTNTFTGVTIANAAQGGVQSGLLVGPISTTATIPPSSVTQSASTFFTAPVLPSVKVLQGSTTVAAGSSGVNVSTFTGAQSLHVAATTPFFCATGTLSVATSTGTATITFTGTSGGNTFTGVTTTSGTGTLATGGAVTETDACSGNALFDPLRTLFIYFRNSDIYSGQAFQPGTTENWLNTLFYDPCLPGASGCTTHTAGSGPGLYASDGCTDGPAGPPFIDTTAGQQLLIDAGVTPLDTDCNGTGQNYDHPAI